MVSRPRKIIGQMPMSPSNSMKLMDVFNTVLAPPPFQRAYPPSLRSRHNDTKNYYRARSPRVLLKLNTSCQIDYESLSARVDPPAGNENLSIGRSMEFISIYCSLLPRKKKMKMKKKIGKERKEIKIAKLVRCRFHFTEYREKYEMNSYNREYVSMKCEN